MASMGLIVGSSIVNPTGRTIAKTMGTGDKVIVADINLAICNMEKKTVFDFDRHSRIEVELWHHIIADGSG
ncbi:hypothetical protein PABG_04943 [Paracoccidioides brasiliensis Pb03]|nr:hypothetical protein PABG_04943 [Paracoccidioides brasiliensis Pb03]